MSEKEHFEPQAPTKKWPTPEELAEMANKIPMQEKWATDTKPLTPEILQDICRRLSDEAPIAHENEWMKIIETLCYKISYSQQPEAQQIWELALERGIDGLANLIENMTAQKIRELASAKPEGSEYKDNPRRYWSNSEARFWHNDLTRLLDRDVGTQPQAMERLAKQLMERASIPYTRRAKELGREITEIRRGDLIWQTAKQIAVARVHLQGRNTLDDAEIEQIINEAFQQV